MTKETTKISEVEYETIVPKEIKLSEQQQDYLKLLLVTEIDSGQTSNTAKVVFNQILEKLNEA